MMMDIIKPDSGDIKSWAKNSMTTARTKSATAGRTRSVQKMTVMDTIIYFASLKGIDAPLARSG